MRVSENFYRNSFETAIETSTKKFRTTIFLVSKYKFRLELSYFFLDELYFTEIYMNKKIKKQITINCFNFAYKNFAVLFRKFKQKCLEKLWNFFFKFE